METKLATPVQIVASLTHTYVEDWIDCGVEPGVGNGSTVNYFERKRGGEAVVYLFPNADPDNQCVVVVGNKEKYRGILITEDRLSLKQKPGKRLVGNPRNIKRTIDIRQEKGILTTSEKKSNVHGGSKMKWSYTVNEDGNKRAYLRPVFSEEDRSVVDMEYNDSHKTTYQKMRNGQIMLATPKARQSKKARLKARYQNPDGN